MKKLLLAVLLLSPFAHAEKVLKARLIASDPETGIKHYCIYSYNKGFQYLLTPNKLHTTEDPKAFSFDLCAV